MIPYRPFLAGPWRLSMGLKALDLDEWIEIDQHFDRDLAERKLLLETRRGEVFGALPESTDGQREVLDLLLDHLPRRFPEHFASTAGAIRSLATDETFAVADWTHAALELAGRLVQEDLCLMQRSNEGYRLVAAVLCFPAHWRLAEKLGRPLAAIHAPVPGFAESLATPVDRFFASIQAERPVWRVNWSLVDTPELFLPHRSERSTVGAEEVGRNLWLRVERQTLRRLPRSGNVLFGIRTYVAPLSEIIDGPETARAFADRVREMPDATADYKAIAPRRVALLRWLDDRADA